ncbi:Hypothetical predicted protein [Mytilus galloprovincialis]|uniref:Uncharacterized protein n=1 Tax=Mytilus galloprovincialis TaxID=29158 RepID=A0A8B6CX01_MYTGA|nr:Hypothetical predicted protein [Mytilus galloprovincialis]
MHASCIRAPSLSHIDREIIMAGRVFFALGLLICINAAFVQLKEEKCVRGFRVCTRVSETILTCGRGVRCITVHHPTTIVICQSPSTVVRVWSGAGIGINGCKVEDVQLWMSKFEERKHKEGLQIGQLSTKLSGPLHILDSQFHLDQLSRQMGSGAFQHLGDLGSQSTCKTALKYAIANLYFRQLVQT